MKKILFGIVILSIYLLALGCQTAEEVSDKEMEDKLSKLSDEELETIIDGDDSALVGHGIVKVPYTKIIAQRILDSRK